MSILVKCKCGKTLSMKPESAGKKGKCPGCGSLFTIPSPNKREAVPVAKEEDPFHIPFAGTPKPAAHAGNSNLIECTDCGKQISIRAVSCPHCGSPRESKPTSQTPGLSNAFADLDLGLPPTALPNTYVDPNRHIPMSKTDHRKTQNPPQKSSTFPIVMIILGMVLGLIAGGVMVNAQNEIDLVQGAIQSGNVELAGRLAENAYYAQQRKGIAAIIGLVGFISFIVGIISLLTRTSSSTERQTTRTTRRNVPSKTTAIILALFLGGLGVHLFYVGRKNEGIIFLLLFIFMSWTAVVPVILVILSCVHIFQFAAQDDASWEEQYGT
jgi:TM2 domain-containing membrane protein YozV